MFKEDVMAGVTLFKADTLITSTALLTRAKMLETRRILTFPNTGGIRHEEYYYSDTKILKANYSYILPEERLTGVTKYFNAKGEPEYIQDHDKGTWEVVKQDNYPYYRTLVKMKKTADSIMVASYGQEFFTEHLRWSSMGSTFYDGKTKGSKWCDYEVWEPKRFLVSYSIRLSADEMYEDQVDVQLDSTGHLFFPFGRYNDVKGFERIPAGGGFVLTKQSAIEKATELGMAEHENKKAFTFLSWTYNEPYEMQLYNGRFLYNVIVNTRTLSLSVPNRRDKVEYKFDVYVFNPWTGEFIEKKKMRSFSKMERGAGDLKYLQPDS